MGNKDNKRYVHKRKKVERLKNIARIMREAKRQNMLTAVGREDLIPKLIEEKTRQQYRICEEHFEKKCLKFSKNRTVKYLSDDAFPTLNLATIGAACSSSSQPLQHEVIQNTTVKGNSNVDSDSQTETPEWEIKHSVESDASCSNHYILLNNEGDDIIIKEENEMESDHDNRQHEIKQSYRDCQFEQCVDPLHAGPTDKVETENNPSTPTPTPPVKCREVDHYESFGAYVASLLKSLPPKKAMMLEPKIIKMIVSVGVEDLSDDEFES